jgi:tyrosyl-tRNA synthetase
MDILRDLEARGLIAQCTALEDLQKRLAQGPITVYAGFDPTADGLHVGHLIPLLALARFQRAGHHVIPVAGGATGQVGDPSGKSEERNLMTEEELSNNIAAIKQELGRLVRFDAPNPARLVDNADWTRGVSLLHFLRDTGKHFSINEMMKKDSVRTRLEERDQGISFTEFSYMLLQAFDFWHLFKHEKCELQIGGSDQWGNITAGIELIRRKEQKQAFGLTLPLLVNSEGKKFGKTEKGAVWLSPKKTSPYQFFQFWVRTEDRDVVRLLKFFTFLSLEEIARLEEATSKNPGQREAQKKLAEEMTRLIHGEEQLRRVLKATEALFGGSLDELDEATLLDVSAEAPRSEVPKERFAGEGFPLADFLVEAKVMPSKREARDKLAAGAVLINNQKQSKDAPALTASSLLFGKYLLVRSGKKNYFLVVAV